MRAYKEQERMSNLIAMSTRGWGWGRSAGFHYSFRGGNPEQARPQTAGDITDDVCLLFEAGFAREWCLTTAPRLISGGRKGMVLEACA